MTHPTDEELDALVNTLSKVKGGELSFTNTPNHTLLACAAVITALRTQLAEAWTRLDYWCERSVEWDAEMLQKDKEVLEAIARADWAEQRVATLEAALAAQIEVDAGIAQRMRENWMCAAGFEGFATGAKNIMDAIRNQRHDRTALDRLMAEHEVRLREAREISEAEKIAIRNKALREAAEICSSIRQRIASGPMPEGARFDYEQSILALIDKDKEN